MATAPYFITEAQFTGNLNIDFGAGGFNSEYAIELEESVCISLLGYDVWLALVADLDASNNPGTAKYTYLVDGIAAGWTGDDGYTQRLKGIKFMLKYFFYYSYQKYIQTEQTTIGEFELVAENAVKSKYGLNMKAVYAQNQGVIHYYELINYINKINSDTPDTYLNFHYLDIESENTFGI